MLPTIVNFFLWMLVFAGIGAACFLFYHWQLRIEQSKYESALNASDYWPR